MKNLVGKKFKIEVIITLNNTNKVIAYESVVTIIDSDLNSITVKDDQDRILLIPYDDILSEKLFSEIT